MLKWTILGLFIIALVAVILHFIFPAWGIFALWVAATVVVLLIALFFQN